jgi:hypothetical protein
LPSSRKKEESEEPRTYELCFDYHLVVIMIIPNFGWVVQLFSFVIDGTITSKTFFSCGLSKIDHVINGH